MPNTKRLDKETNYLYVIKLLCSVYIIDTASFFFLHSGRDNAVDIGAMVSLFLTYFLLEYDLNLINKYSWVYVVCM